MHGRGGAVVRPHLLRTQGCTRPAALRSERRTYPYMNPRWFRDFALREWSYHAAGLAGQGAVF
eukprot:6523428-Pyramimonas_sp.AAC.1